MANIRMPDGTIIRGVPDGVSKQDIQAHLVKKYGQERFDQMTGSTKRAPSGPAASSSSASDYLRNIAETEGRDPTPDEQNEAVRMRRADAGLPEFPEKLNKFNNPYQGTARRTSEFGREVEGSVSDGPVKRTELQGQSGDEANRLRAEEEAANAPQMSATRDAQAVSQIDQGDPLTSTAAGGGVLGLPSAKTKQERVAEQGRVIERMVQIGAPAEQYGMTEEEIDNVMTDMTAIEMKRRKDAADSQPDGPDEPIDNTGKSYWKAIKKKVSHLSDEFFRKQEAPEAAARVREKQYETIGAMYLDAVARENPDQADTANDIIDEVAGQYGIDGATYHRTLATQLDNMFKEEQMTIDGVHAYQKELLEDMPQALWEDNKLGYIGGKLIENSNSIAYIMAGFATRSPSVLATLMGTDVYNQAYTDARADGRTQSEAFQDAGYSSFIELATEGIPLGRILKAAKVGGRSRAAKILEGIGTEAVQELTVEALQMGYDIGVLDEDISVGEAMVRLRDAGILGAVMGGGISTLANVSGDNEMNNLNTDIQEAKRRLQTVAMRVQSDLSVEGTLTVDGAAKRKSARESIEAAQKDYRDAVRAKKKLVLEREQAELAKKEGKAKKKEDKRQSKLSDVEKKREAAVAAAEKADQAVVGEVTEADREIATVLDKAINAELGSEDAAGVQAALDAGYMQITKAGTPVVLQAGKRRLEAVRAAEKGASGMQDEIIEPTPYESPETRAKKQAIDEEIGRRLRGEPEPTIVEPKPFTSQQRRKADLTKRVTSKVTDPAVREKIADDIIKAEEIEQSYNKRNIEEAARIEQQRNEDYSKALDQVTDVDLDVAANLALLDEKSVSGYVGTRLGDVLRNAMQTLEKEEAKATAALKAKFANMSTQGTLFDVTGVLVKGTALYANAVKVGALKIAKHGLKYSAWTADMIGEFGESIRPVLARVYHDSKKKVQDIMKLSHEKFASGERAGELKYSPKQYAKRGGMTRLRNELRRLADEGSDGRLWYEKSGKEILKAAGGDKAKARKLAGLLAIYSSGTAVSANTTNALKMWAQFYGADGNLKTPKKGTLAGRFGEQDRTAIEWLESNADDAHHVETFGNKRFAFFVNIMREIDPKNYDTGQGVTVDLWMMRALGYDQDAPTDAQYAFASSEIMLIAKEMGWENQQAQAAIWVAIKARWEFIQKKAKEQSVKKGLAEFVPTKKGAPLFEVIGASREEQIENEKKIIGVFRDQALKVSREEITKKLEESKADFADNLSKHYATISWEAEPSTDIGGRLNNLSLADKLLMQAEVAEAVTNPDTGREYIAEWLDLLGQNQFVGAGSWNMNVGAAVQNSVIAPVKHKAYGAAITQQEAKQAMNGYAAIVGYLMQQDAVLWHKPYYSSSLKRSNGVEVITKTLDVGQTKDLYQQIVAVAEQHKVSPEIAIKWAPMIMDGAVRVLNFSKTKNTLFHKIIREAANNVRINGAIEVFESDGMLVSNDWSANKSGEQYVNQIVNNQNPRVEKAFERAKRELSPRIKAIRAKYAKENGNGKQRAILSPLSMDNILVGGDHAAQEIITRFGTVEPGRDTNSEMRVYNLDSLINNPELMERMSKDFGFEVKYFSFESNPELGVEFVLPKLKKEGYKDGVVWIYDPRNSAGSFKGAVEYTRAWRISHEIGHAIAERFMHEKYGPSKRYGRLGRTMMVDRGVQGKQVKVEERPLTLMEAQRAVEWEDVAFRTQREILKIFGVTIDAEGFNKEFNINIQDATYRVLTGEFGDPGDRGFTPSTQPTNVKSVLKLLENAEEELATRQGRPSTKGVDLKTWERVPVSTLRSALQGQASKGKNKARVSLATGRERAIQKGDMRFRVFRKGEYPMLDVTKAGNGLKGAESKRHSMKVISAYPNTGFKKEVGLGNVEYIIDVPADNMYNANADPMHLKAKSKVATGFTMEDGKKVPYGEQFDMHTYEQLIKEAGFAGYYTPEASGNLKGQARFFDSLMVVNVPSRVDNELPGTTSTFAISDRPRVTIVENVYDEFEVREANGEVYHTDDLEDAVGTARSIHGTDATVVVVNEDGEVITTIVAKTNAKPIKLSGFNPKYDMNAQVAVDEFLDEWIEVTSHNPLSPDERVVDDYAAVTLRPQNGEVWIDSLRSFRKGAGNGSRALKDIIELADQHGVTLRLTAKPFDTGGNELDYKSLVQFYQRNGFRTTRETQDHKPSSEMVREPRNVTPKFSFHVKRPKGKTNAGYGMDVNRVRDFTKSFGNRLGLGNFKVVESIEELPDSVYVDIMKLSGFAQVNGVFVEDPIDGPTMYVVANNLFDEHLRPSTDMLVDVLMHETIGHFGARAFLGEKGYNDFMDAIRRAFPEEVKRRGKDMSMTPYGRRLAAEEVFAYFVGENLKGVDVGKVAMSFIDKAMLALKRFLAQLGVRKLSQDDLFQMMFRVTDFVRNTPEALLKKRAMQVERMRQADWERTNQEYKQALRDARIEQERAHKAYVDAHHKGQDTTKERGRVNEADSAVEMLESGEYVTARFSMNLEKERKSDPALDRFMTKIGHGKGDKLVKLRDWWEARRSNIKRSFEIEMLDQFAGIKHMEQDLGITGPDSGYMSVRLTAGTDVIIRSAIENGVPAWDADGSVRMDSSHLGLLEVLAPIAKDPEMLKAFEAFLVARRAKRLKKENREKLFSREEIGAAFKFIRKNKTYKLFKDTALELAAYKSKVLDFAQEAGLIDPVSRKLWEHNDHVPFYRVLAENNKKGPFASSRIGRVGKAVHRLKGGTDPLRHPLESIVKNLSMLIEASVKNRATADVVNNFMGTGVVTKAPQAVIGKALIPMNQIKDMLFENGVSLDAVGQELLDGVQQLTSLQAPTGDNVISVQENGKKQFYFIHDSGVMRGIDNVSPNQWIWLMKLLRFPKRLLTRSITLMPDFILKNWFRDIFHTYMLHRHGTIIPIFDSGRGWAKAIAHDDTFKDMIAGGGVFDSGFVNASDPEKTNIAIRRALLGKGRHGILDTPKKLKDFYMRIANGAENAHRIVVYQKTLKETGSRKQALFESRDLMDFSVRGANPVIRFLTETVPFWGARVQGISRTAKGFAESPALTLMRSTPIILASVALYMINRDDDRYKKLSEYEKRMYYHFYDVFEDQDHYQLPKPFEVGALFSSIPEVITEYMLSNEPDRGRAAAHSTSWVISEMLSLWPDVQTINPVYELMINKNRFTEAPIISEWEKQLDPRDQYSYRTDKSIKWLADQMPDSAPDIMKSPKQLEHLAQGYIGASLDYALAASQFLFDKQLNGDAAQPTMRWDETPFFKSFKREPEGKYDDYLNTMYDVLAEADKIHNSINLNKKLPKSAERDERIRTLREDNQALLYARGPMDTAASAISKVNKAIRQVYADTRMTPDEKRAKIDGLLKKRSEIAEKVYERRPGGTLNKYDGSEPVKSRVEEIMDAISGKPKDEQVDELIGARLPHTATLINDINISEEKLRSAVA